MSLQDHAVKPELPTPFPNIPELWRDPITDILIPKNPEENLKWRTKLLQEAENDEGLQDELWTACSQSILFWLNAFGFTYAINEVAADGKRTKATHSHLPWVTWEIQDKHIQEIERAIAEGGDLLTDKTRDMGASWNHIAVLHHQWLFHDERLFLEMSRVETDVDGSNNPRCLFVKHDYINKWLPEWMIPQIDRTKLHIVNQDNGSRIDGESSNKAAASGDRRHAVLLDEFAKMENAEKIKAATRDVGPRLVNSTPWGPGTAYSKWRQSGQINVFTLPWYEHPEKGRDRYVTQDPSSGKWQIRSPWYDEEEKHRSPKEMAQEIDCDHIGSGDTYFESHIVEQHKTMFMRPAKHNMTIDFKPELTSAKIPDAIKRSRMSDIKRAGKGPLKVWQPLIKGRLDQTRNYVLGIDIGKGQGASNSVISVFCPDTCEKVAEWADANTPPYDFARVACAVAVWVGGRTHGSLPLMIWEQNGPGWDFGREVVRKYQYPRYWKDRAIGTAAEKQTQKYGWHSSKDKKELVVGNYREALANGGFINHSEQALEEALTYIYYDGDAGIGPSALLDESANARKTHGDRVIADALALWGSESSLKQRTPKEQKGSLRTIGGRKEERTKRKKRERRHESFDFRGA